MKTATTNFLFDDNAVASLAKDYLAAVKSAEGVNVTYLRVLVAHAQKELTVTRVSIPATIAAIERADEHLYRVIMEAVVTPEIAATTGLEPAESRRRTLERNRRTNFARSAKATLMGFAKAGGKLRSVDADTVTKLQLRAVYGEGRPARPLEARADRAEARVEKIVRELAADDMEKAREFITSLYTKLTDIVTLPPVKQRQMRDISLRPTAPQQQAAH